MTEISLLRDSSGDEAVAGKRRPSPSSVWSLKTGASELILGCGVLVSAAASVLLLSRRPTFSYWGKSETVRRQQS